MIFFFAFFWLSFIYKLKSLGITRTIYRTGIYISRELEPRMDLRYLTAWIEYIMLVKIPIYLMLNIVAILFAFFHINFKEFELLDSFADYIKIAVPGIGLTLLFIWNLKLSFWGLLPKHIVKELDKTWLASISKNLLN